VRQRDDDGFTLIELMVVVLIIAILIAIAIPTFLGARTRAQDRATQADIRTAYAAEKVVYTDDQAFTETTASVSAIEPSLAYVTGDVPALTDRVYLHVHAATNGELYISARSPSGNCFYLHELPGRPVEYAQRTGSSAACPVADTRAYSAEW
jgi:type IV pilus assembly protein PilA